MLLLDFCGAGGEVLEPGVIWEGFGLDEDDLLVFFGEPFTGGAGLGDFLVLSGVGDLRVLADSGGVGDFRTLAGSGV